MVHSNSHQQRAQRHWYEDGLGEIAVGIGLLGYAIWLWLTGGGADLNLSMEAQVLLTAALFFVGIVAMRTVIEWAKARVSYPRTGYVKLRHERQIKLGQLALSVALMPLAALLGAALPIGLIIIFGSLGINSSMLLLGAMVALPAFLLAWRIKLARLVLVGLLIVVVSVVLTLSKTFGMLGITLLYGASGLLVLLSGLLALRHFVQTHPIVEEEAQS